MKSLFSDPFLKDKKRHARLFQRPAREIVIASIAALVLGLFANASRGTESATGLLTEIATGPSFNTFTITLNNTSSPGLNIQTFWFAWIPGQDYLATRPLSVQTPPGWTDIITGGGSGDGFAIQFDTTSAPLTSGSSLSGFGFTSTDTLTQLEGNATFHSTTPVTTTEVSDGPNFSGSNFSNAFVVSVNPVPAPEPGSAWLLISGGGLAYLWFRTRRIRRAAGEPAHT